MASSGQIHVLDLLLISPDDDENEILKCDIRTIHLGNDGASEEYEALSYVWGSQSQKVPILVSGQRFGVTRGLHAALQQLRLQDRKRSLWIDQLCINQSDPTEKAEQVPLMGNIYSSCSQCLVWLGDIPHDKNISLEDAAAAFDLVRYIAAAASTATEHNSESLFPVPSCLSDRASPSDSSRGRVMRALKAMSPGENPWWRRIWTIQEAALSQRVLMLCGPLSLPLDTMQKAARVFTGQAGVLPQPVLDYLLLNPDYATVFQTLLAHAIWLEITSDRRDCPMSLIRRWRGRLATDPRDKVYGILGLLNPRNSLPSVEACSYKIPAADLFSSVTIDLIVHENGLRPLVNDPRLEPHLATKDMPSWALDLKALARWDTDWYHHYGYQAYKADDGLPPLDLKALQTAAAESNNRTLRLRGVMIDAVQEVGPALYVPEYGFKTDRRPSDRIRAWYDTAQRSGRDGGREAFYRLIVGDLIRNGNQWPIRRACSADIACVRAFLDAGGGGSSSIDHDYDLLGTIFGMTRNQAFFVTKTGLLGLGHEDTEPGDQVWIFAGGRVPFTLRGGARRGQHGEDDGLGKEGPSIDDEFDYRFVGRAYVQGIMQGEAFRDKSREMRDEQYIRIH